MKKLLLLLFLLVYAFSVKAQKGHIDAVWLKTESTLYRLYEVDKPEPDYRMYVETFTKSGTYYPHLIIDQGIIVNGDTIVYIYENETECFEVVSFKKEKRFTVIRNHVEEDAHVVLPKHIYKIKNKYFPYYYKIYDAGDTFIMTTFGVKRIEE